MAARGERREKVVSVSVSSLIRWRSVSGEVKCVKSGVLLCR